MISKPDQGYAYVICTAGFVANILIFGVTWTVGVFYAIFITEFTQSCGAIALVSSLNTATFSVVGPLSSYLTNRFGNRVTSIAGGFISSLGLVLSAFATNIYTLYITFGIITGFGLGIAFIPCNTIVSAYFVKWRPIANGILVSGIGLGTFLHPPLIRLCVHEYSWQGAMLILGGVTLNLCVCGALLRPFNNATQENISVIVSENVEKDNNNLTKKIIPHTTDFGNKEVCEKLVKDSNGLLYCENNIDSSNTMEEENILKNPNFLLLGINQLILSFSLSIIYIHLAAYSTTTTKSNSDQSAMLFTIIGISNFIGRPIYGALGHVPYMKSTLLYTVGFLLAGILTTACPLGTSYSWLVAYSAMFGFLVACCGLSFEVVIEFTAAHYLTDGLGYLQLFNTFGTLTGAPLAGWLYEWTGNYASSLYLGGIIMILASLLTIYPTYFVYTKYYGRGKTISFAKEDDKLQQDQTKIHISEDFK